MDRVRLREETSPSLAILREMCGDEELGLGGTSTMDALWLLGRLLVDGDPQSVAQTELTSLSPQELERLLAAVYRRIYGQRIETSVRCLHCRIPFDLDFSLPQLLESLGTRDGPGLPQRMPDGTYRMDDGLRFRLPNGEDASVIANLPTEEAVEMLLERCVLKPSGIQQVDSVRREVVERAMEAVAPIADVDIEAHCPECGQAQDVHFDLQHYLLASILRDRPRLMWEVHTLASAYGWSLSEIKGLARSQRRALVGMVEAQGASYGGGWS